MRNNASTYALVLAATYPQLRTAIEAVMHEDLTSESLEKFQASLIHGPILFSLEKIVHAHSSNYNNINLNLQKIDEVIDRIAMVNYGDLTDIQKNRLPNLAKEVDEANFQIREEIYPILVKEKAGLGEVLKEALNKAGEYLKSLDSELNQGLSDINEKFSLKVEWTEGKNILNFAMLKEWLERNQQIDKKIRDKILALESDEVASLLKAVLMLEFMSHVFENAAMGGDSSKQDQAKSMISSIASLTFSTYAIAEDTEGSMVAKMKEVSEKVQKLYEELFSYPVNEKELDDTEVKDLDRLSKQDTIFTNVDDPVED